MRRTWITIEATILAGMLILMVASCRNVKEDEPEIIIPVERDESHRIEIFGGTVATIGSYDNPSSTRGDSEPSQQGYCNADRLHIWFYKTTPGTSRWSSGLKTPPYSGEVEISEYQMSGANHANKSFAYQYSFKADHQDYYFGFTMPSLAFEDKDRDFFSISGNTNNSRFTALSLSLVHDNEESIYVTPELFFGYLKFSCIRSVYEDYEELVTLFDDSSSFYLLSKNTDGKFTYEEYLYGGLYRIVSQFNVTVDDINPEEVERVDLYLSNVPDRLGLSGNHGRNYAVTALEECFSKPCDSSKDLADNYLRVATSVVSPEGRASLSCHLLPSLRGREACVRVYYKDGEKSYTDYAIRPSADAFLSEVDSEVYTGSELKGSSELWFGNKLCVYNSERHEFYSYANIRVNLSGKLSDLTAFGSE